MASVQEGKGDFTADKMRAHGRTGLPFSVCLQLAVEYQNLKMIRPDTQ